MSFERLIVCVDTSGSMAGGKLDNAKKLLLGVVNSFGCDTKYFKFDSAPQMLSSHAFSNLRASGGTRVEYTLKELFSNHFRKWAHEGKNTKFMFVTDAEDSITDEASVIEAKGKCIKAYGGKLDCECVLTGGGGGCSSELKRIFGSNAFQHCQDKDFQKVLGATCGGISKANTISNTVLPNLEQGIKDLADAEQKANQQHDQDMKDIITKLKGIKTDTDKAKQQINAAKKELNTLNTTTPTIIADADAARTADEMTAAEEALESQTNGYQSQYANVSTAGQILDEAQTALNTEGKRADKMAEELSKKADKVSKDASVIISNIIRTIKELTSITTGAYKQVKHLKAEFNKQLTDLSLVVSKNNNLMKEFENVKNKITTSFKGIRSRRTELSDFKKEIASQIQSLNSALERLDDRW